VITLDGLSLEESLPEGFTLKWPALEQTLELPKYRAAIITPSVAFTR
jgi:hypothetical protein